MHIVYVLRVYISPYILYIQIFKLKTSCSVLLMPVCCYIAIMISCALNAHDAIVPCSKSLVTPQSPTLGERVARGKSVQSLVSENETINGDLRSFNAHG